MLVLQSGKIPVVGQICYWSSVVQLVLELKICLAQPHISPRLLQCLTSWAPLWLIDEVWKQDFQQWQGQDQVWAQDWVDWAQASLLTTLLLASTEVLQSWSIFKSTVHASSYMLKKCWYQSRQSFFISKVWLFECKISLSSSITVRAVLNMISLSSHTSESSHFWVASNSRNLSHYATKSVESCTVDLERNCLNYITLGKFNLDKKINSIYTDLAFCLAVVVPVV